MYKKQTIQNINNNMQNIPKPHVGAPHFRQYAKGVRGSTYTFIRALLDIIDNAIIAANNISIRMVWDENTGLTHILIQDDVPNGFENIYESDSSSPLHIGHERPGQENDSETSQYGRGFKDGTMYVSDKIHIYTRSISENHDDNYVHVNFDYDSMIKCEDPSQSYEPATFEKINCDTYNSIHPYGVGSTIAIENIRSAVNNFGTLPEIENNVMDAISHTYSGILVQNSDKNIFVNGKRVEIEKDAYIRIIHNPKCVDRMISYYIMVTLDGDGQMTKISYKRVAKNINYGIYDIKQNKIEAQSADAADYNTDKNNVNAYEVIFMGTSTYDTPINDILFKNYIRVIRCGRNHGDIPPLGNTPNDGYHNHQFNCITYTSKKLNPHIGITSDKHVHVCNNILYKCFTILHKEKLMLELNNKKFKLPTSDDVSVASTTVSRRGRPPKRPVVAEPVVSDPVVTEQVVTEQVVTEPVVTDPVITDPVITDPVITDPVITDPVITDPVIIDPVIIDPVVTDPVIIDPVITDPVVTDPVVTDPVVTDPIVTQNPNTAPTVSTILRSECEITCLTSRNAIQMLDSILACSTNNKDMDDDMIKLAKHIASARGKSVANFIARLLLLDNQLEYTDNQLVTGGSALSKIYDKYIKK